MLQNQGHAMEAHQIDLQWEDLQQTSGQQEPQGFRLAFPDALLKKVVEEVVVYAQSVSIKPFNAQTMPIAALLNKSWRQFIQKP